VKTISGAMQTHLDSGSTTLAQCLKIVRTDGTVYGFTDHDTVIVFDGVTYSPVASVDTSAIDTAAGFNVDNLEMRGFMAQVGLTEADVAAGRWDFAAVNVIAVNWADLTMGAIKLRRGWLGEVSLTLDFKAELRGMAQKLTQVILELSSELCKADLFDARCKVVATEGVLKFSGVAVSTIVLAQRQFTAAALGQAAGFFTAGKVDFTSGANAGLSMEVKVHAGGGDITLAEALPYPINVADAFTIFAGCRKRYAEDCGTKFNNKINFRGFPHLPGLDQVLRGP
jgi:uncharacterized phage protein (TIGR02218 family)